MAITTAAALEQVARLAPEEYDFALGRDRVMVKVLSGVDFSTSTSTVWDR